MLRMLARGNRGERNVRWGRSGGGEIPSFKQAKNWGGSEFSPGERSHHSGGRGGKDWPSQGKGEGTRY